MAIASALSIISLNLARWPTRIVWPFFGDPPYLTSKFHNRRVFGLRARTVYWRVDEVSLRTSELKNPWEFRSLCASIRFNSSVFASWCSGLAFLVSLSCCFWFLFFFKISVKPFVNSFAILFSSCLPVWKEMFFSYSENLFMLRSWDYKCPDPSGDMLWEGLDLISL